MQRLMHYLSELSPFDLIGWIPSVLLIPSEFILAWLHSLDCARSNTSLWKPFINSSFKRSTITKSQTVKRNETTKCVDCIQETAQLYLAPIFVVVPFLSLGPDCVFLQRFAGTPNPMSLMPKFLVPLNPMLHHSSSINLCVVCLPNPKSQSNMKCQWMLELDLSAFARGICV